MLILVVENFTTRNSSRRGSSTDIYSAATSSPLLFVPSCNWGDPTLGKPWASPVLPFLGDWNSEAKSPSLFLHWYPSVKVGKGACTDAACTGL